jgi:predicted metal-dependent peptidase
MAFNLDDRLYLLLREEPFYGSLSLHLVKEVSTEVPTLAVGLTKEGHYKLFYNADFLSSLSDSVASGALIHEFGHLVFKHVSGRGPLNGKIMGDELTNEEMQTAKLWNIATDLAVNSTIPAHKLGKDWLLPGREQFKKMRKGQSAEQYFKQLNNLPSEEKQKLVNSVSTMDSHDEWIQGEDDSSKTAKIIADSRLEQAIKEATESAMRKGWGSVPKRITEELIDLLGGDGVDWTSLLRYFIQRSVRGEKRTTYKSRNRRFPDFPGYRRKHQSKILVAIDESASVPNSLYGEFFSELNDLTLLTEFTLLPFDAAPGEPEVWKKGEIRKARRRLRGGTNFKAVVEWAEQEGCYDGIVFLTDMGAPQPPKTRLKRLWITTERHLARCKWRNDEEVAVIRDM